MDRFLAHARTAGAFADGEPSGSPRKRERFRADERVVKDEVGAAQALYRPPREQPRVSGTRADQRNESDHKRAPSPCLSYRAISASSNCGRRWAIGIPFDFHLVRISRAELIQRSRSSGRSVSSPSRSNPASAGASPFVEIATVTPDRRITPPR